MSTPTTPQTTYFGDVNVYGNTTMSGTLAVLGTPALFISNLGVATDRFSAMGTQATPFQYAWTTAANTTSVNFLTNIPGPVGIGTAATGTQVSIQGNVQVSNSVSTTNVNVTTSINTGSVMNVNFLTGPGGVGVGTNVIGTAALAVLGTMNSVTSFQVANLILSRTLNVTSANIFSIGTSNIGVGTAPVTGGAPLAVQGFASVSNAVTTTNVYVTTANVGTLNTGALVNSTGFFGFGTATAAGTTAYVLGDLGSSNAASAPVMTSNGLIASGGINVATVVARSNVGVGIAPVQGGPALSVAGNVFISNTFTTPQVFAGSMNVSNQSNIVTGLATSNVLIGPAADLYKGFNLAVAGNVVISNALQTTNVYANRVNTVTANTLSIAAPVGVGATGSAGVWAYLPFNGTLADAAGGGNLTNPVGTGTLTYATTSGPGGGPSLQLATSSYATYTMSSTAINLDLTGASISLWFRADSAFVGSTYLIDFNTTANPLYGLYFIISSSGLTRLIIITSGGQLLNDVSLTWTIGQWYHLTFIVDPVSTTTAFWRNGTLVATSAPWSGTAGYLKTTFRLGVGGTAVSTSMPEPGSFADFRVYNSTLTGPQIAAIYAQNAAPPLLGYALQIQGNLYASNTATISTANTTRINASLNSNVVTLTATSNVGIGTTPVAGGPSLAVQGNLFVSNALTTTNVFATTSANTATLNTGSIFTTSSGFLGISTTDPSGTVLYVPGNVYASNALTTGTITVTNSNALASNVTTIYVSSNVGVGTAPVAGGAILAVQGNAFVSNALETTNVFATTSANILTLNTTSIFTTASGFLGISTTDPSGTALYLPGNVYASTALVTTNVAATRMNVTGLANTTDFTMATGQFLGIGGATPTGNALEVSGNAFVSDAVTAANVFATTSANVGTLNTLSIFTRNSFLGIGTSAASGTSLFVPGNVYASTSTNTPAMFTPAASVSATGNALSVTSGTGIVVPTRFVAVAQSTTAAAYSNDGITWVASTMPSSVNWQSVTVNPTTGRFVAVAQSPAAAAAAYSNDGITWVASTMPSAAAWLSVTVNPTTGRFVAVAQSSAAAAYSNDGITWVVATLPGTANWQSVTVNPTTGRFVAVAGSTTSNVAAYSNDGITWVVATLPVSRGWHSVTCNPTTGRFVTVATSSASAAYSNDGITWIASTMPSGSSFEAVTVNPTTGRFVAVAQATTAAAYSNDGITWVASTMPSAVAWNSVTCNPTTGRFVAVATASASAAYSDDGINWVASTMPSSANWQSVTAYYSVGSPSLSLLGNLFASNAVTTTNITATTANVTRFANVTNLAQISAISLGVSAGGAKLNVRGNVVASNSVTMTNVLATSVNTVTMNVTSIFGAVGVGAAPSGTALYVQGNMYASNALTIAGDIAATSMNVATTLNVGSITTQFFIANTVAGGAGPNIYIPTSITTTNVFATNVNAASYVGTSGSIGINTAGSGYALRIEGNLATSNTLSSLPDVSALQSIYYVDDITKRSPHLLPTPSNAAAIQNWISTTCNSASQTKAWWATSSVPAYGNVTAQPGYSGGVYLPDGRALFVPSTTSTIGVYTQDSGLFSSIDGAAPGFSGGVLLPNGNVVFAPQFSNVGMFNPVSYLFSNILALSSNAYNAVLTSNGIAFTPLNTSTASVVLYNTTAVNVLTRAAALDASTPLQTGSVLLPSGNVLFSGPLGSSNLMHFDPVALALSNIAVGTSGYAGLVLGPNGNVVAVPSGSNAAVINPVTATSTNVATGGGFSGGVLLPSGKVIFIPRTATAIGTLDPVTLEYSSFGNMSGFSGGTLLTSGQVVFAPETSVNVCVLETEVPVSQEFCASPYFNHGP